jgi:sortase A
MATVMRRMGWTCIGMGSFVLYFLVYQLVGTSVAASRDQADLRRSLERQWAAEPGTGAVAAPSQPRKPRAAITPPLKGQGFAIIKIPKIGVERVVVEGVDRDDLRKGPGHVPSTALPDRPGTFGISGHRTTYGAPFYRLDELRKGDRIIVVTKAATFEYAVSRTRIVRPTDTWVLDNVPGPDGKPRRTIVLTTCNPRYSARERLIVFGDLVSDTLGTARVAA